MFYVVVKSGKLNSFLNEIDSNIIVNIFHSINFVIVDKMLVSEYIESISEVPMDLRATWRN